MYIPPQFAATDPAFALEVMRTHNFANLVSSEDEGRPVATPLPVVVSEKDGQVFIHFHLARANPHVATLRAGRPSMLAFSGPHAYMSPSVYPDLKRVPTWNYIAVHAYGEVAELTEAHQKDALLKSLIALHEPAYAQQWIGLDAEFQETMLGAIAAFCMTVTQLDSKFKLNQHRKEAHAAMKVSYANGTLNEQEIGRWMTRLGL